MCFVRWSGSEDSVIKDVINLVEVYEDGTLEELGFFLWGY